jgi:hypothetical protein
MLLSLSAGCSRNSLATWKRCSEEPASRLTRKSVNYSRKRTCITRGSDDRPGEAEGCAGVANTEGQVWVKGLPWFVYLLQKVSQLGLLT